MYIEPSATDDSGQVEVVCDPASGDVLALGDNDVWCTATDGSGHSRLVTFVVTVVDDTAPVFSDVRDQVFREPVCEVLLLRIQPRIYEWQHRKRRARVARRGRWGAT